MSTVRCKVRTSLVLGIGCGVLLALAGPDIRSEDAESPDDLARRVTREPREVLAAMSIGESELHFFVDGQPLQPDDISTVARLLDRMPRFSPQQWRRWQTWDVDWERLTSDSVRFRGAVISLDGHVREVRVIELPEVLQDQFPFQGFYEVQMESLVGQRRWTVYLRTLPEAWNERVGTDVSWYERAHVAGMFLKVGPDTTADERRTYVFASPRLAWLPDEKSQLVADQTDWLLLAEAGVDIGRLADLTDRTRWSAKERDTFYETLRAVPRMNNAQWEQHADSAASVPELLLHPQQYRGQVVTVRGQARRALRVETDDVTRQLYGIDHYYEVDVLVESEQSIVIPVPEDTTGESDKRFDRYPFVFCVRSLPDGMPAGEAINESVTGTGVYLKLWGYSTDYMSRGQGSTRKLQFSPLLVANRLEWQPSVPPRDGLGNWLAGGLFVSLALAIIGTFVWFAREDKR